MKNNSLQCVSCSIYKCVHISYMYLSVYILYFVRSYAVLFVIAFQVMTIVE